MDAENFYCNKVEGPKNRIRFKADVFFFKEYFFPLSGVAVMMPPYHHRGSFCFFPRFSVQNNIFWIHVIHVHVVDVFFH